MSHELYDLLFDGVAEGQDPQQVKTAFAQLFGLDEAKVERIFSANNAVLKTNVNAATAEKYIARLSTLGVVVAKRRVVPVESSLSIEMPQDVPEQQSDAHESPMQQSNTQHAADEFDSTAKTADVNAEENNATRWIGFEFSGKGFEYFKIWIVNILLSIVTLGIYSAWAKVRNKQYFYGNTSLDNASFEYTAEPLKILKGRIIAVAFFIVYSIALNSAPLLGAAMGLLLLVFLPWIIVNSLKFNARHSSYRNINFRFVGTILGALKAFILWPLAGLLSFGILFPFVWKKQTAYITNNHLYGSAPFSFDVNVKEYYKMLLLLIGGIVAFCIVMAVAFGSAFAGLLAAGVENMAATILATMLGLIPAIIAYLVFYFAVIAYVVVTMTNIHFNHTQLQAHRFESTWATVSYTLLLLTNTIGVLLTLGLFIPFAKIRTAAYKATHITFAAKGSLDSFIAAEQEQSNSLGEGVHDIFDIDISL